jgi:hypothetical protein
VDQRYLDAFPVYFEGVRIVKHLGCNVAQWNSDFLKRKEVDGEILINGKWPIVFIHFSSVTIQNIQNGIDHILRPYLELHQSYIKQARNDIRRLSLNLASTPFASNNDIQ